MKLILKSAVFSILAVMFCLLSVSAQTAESTTNLWANSSIAGAWRINFAESDNILVKAQAMLKNQLEQTVEAKNTELKPTISISLFPPESLILAGENEREITINEGFNNFVLTRTILTDGKARIGEVEGVNYGVTATQKKDLLKIETISPRGNKMTELFVLTESGQKLIVTVRIEDSTSRELINLKRVYDRTILDVLDDAAPQIQ